MDLQLSERAVLVSGGARGIGAATAAAFHREGALVLIVDRDAEAAEALADGLPGVHWRKADLTDEREAAAAVEEAIRRWGRLDALINNAGANDSVGLEAPPTTFFASVHRNLMPAYALTHAARAVLCESKGTIINVSSKVAETGQGATSGYAAAKGAINALTREWAVALAPHGVRVNAVIPAECDTDQYRRWFAMQPDPPAARARVEALVPLGRRLTTAAEVADAIVWLASPLNGHITGQWIHVDGGYTHLDRAVTSEHRWA
jgi:L-fucose dehydrogenase